LARLMRSRTVPQRLDRSLCEKVGMLGFSISCLP
jgi:hypothetical protein